jgi:predicted peptidase
LFQEHSIQYTGRGYRDREFRYRHFVPETPGPEDKRPLLVWLHGRGTSGNDNSSQLRHLSSLVFTAPWRRERYPFFLLAVQCPRDNPIWTASDDADFDMLDVVMAILEQTIRSFPIDADRISLAGASSGGNGCWELAARRPETFAGIAPLASSGGDLSRVERLAKVPIWAFNSAYEPGDAVDSVRQTVARIKRAGGTAHLTEVASTGHNCWTAAFERHELLAWLLAQKRGSTGNPLPGAVSPQRGLQRMWQSLTAGWTPAQLLAQIGIPAVLLFATWSALRQRRLSRSGKLPACRATEEENKRNTNKR